MSGYFSVLLDSDNEDGPSQNKDAKAKGKKDVAPAGMNNHCEKDFYVETMLNIANISE